MGSLVRGLHAPTLRATVALLAALVLVAPASARADEPAACPEVAPPDDEVQRRLTWIERRIDDTEDDVRRWFSAFVVVHTLLTGVQLTLAISVPDDDARPDFIVNAIGGGLGLATLLISMPPILGAGDFVRSLARDTPEARLAALRAAEDRLRRSAEASGFVRSELSAVASALYVEAGSLTLLFLGRTTGAFTHAVGGVVLGQGRLLLHPTGAIDSWRTYRARHADAGCRPEDVPPPAPSAPGLALSPAVMGPAGAGVSLTLSF